MDFKRTRKAIERHKQDLDKEEKEYQELIQARLAEKRKTAKKLTELRSTIETITITSEALVQSQTEQLETKRERMKMLEKHIIGLEILVSSAKDKAEEMEEKEGDFFDPKELGYEDPSTL